MRRKQLKVRCKPLNVPLRLSAYLLNDYDLEESQRQDIQNTVYKERTGLLAKLYTEASLSDCHWAISTCSDWFSDPSSSFILISYLVLYNREVWATKRSSRKTTKIQLLKVSVFSLDWSHQRDDRVRRENSAINKSFQKFMQPRWRYMSRLRSPMSRSASRTYNSGLCWTWNWARTTVLTVVTS